MTDEDKKIVAEYMGWDVCLYAKCLDGTSVVVDDVRDVYFDLNDAGLCKDEMVKRGEWDSFSLFIIEKIIVTMVKMQEFILSLGYSMPRTSLTQCLSG